MTVNRTTLLDLPLPVTGTESGTWGDTTNNGLTQYVDIAIAGMSNLTSANFTAGALTIETTEGDSSATNISATSAQYAGFRVSSLAVNSTITVGNTGTSPARSYRLINADATYSLTFKATGQTGVTLLPGQSAVVAFNGTDYVIVGVVGAGSTTDNTVPRFDGTTGEILQSSGVTIDDSNNVSGVAQLNITTLDATNIEVTNIKAKDGTAAASIADSTGIVTVTAAPVMSALTASQAVFTTAGKALTSNAITGTGNVVMSASPTLTGTIAGASLQLSSLTSGRVTYATTSGLLTDSANLLYSGTDLTVYGLTVGRGAGAVATNTAVGASALATNTTGANNTAVGYLAVNKNTTGRYNVAMGQEALYNNTTADYNVAIGLAAAYQNTTGAYNVGIGGYALYANTTGSFSTAVGYQALYSNTASDNNAFGYFAMYTNTSGTANIAIGTAALRFNTTGNYNNALGYQALTSNTTGSNNVAIGYTAFISNSTGAENVAVGNRAAESSTTSNNITAVGYRAARANTAGTTTAFGAYALDGNTSGLYNTALGMQALPVNTTASNNTAVGYQAGYSNTTGALNTALGAQAGYSTTTGANNVALGFQSLYANTTGLINTAVGNYALYSNTTGGYNVAVGGGQVANVQAALFSNTTGQFNVAVGTAALYSNTTASNNTAVGYQAGYNNTTGFQNAFLGNTAGYSNTTGNYQTFVGQQAGYSTTTGSANTFVGNGAGYFVTTGSKNTILGVYNGNQGGLDIRTLSNRIVLSDGDGNPRWYIDDTGAAGYGPTTGGAVTQATSRTTGVTLNKPTGAITLVSAAGTTSWQSFTVTNNTVAATDTIIVSQKSGTDLYQIFVTNVAAGSFQITFATTGGTTTEQPVFNFALIKGQTT